MVKKQDAAGIKKLLKKLISEVGEIQEKDLKDDARFTEDLGIDSMKALEIVAMIEKKLKIAIPEENIPKIHTPNDVYGVVQKLLKI